MPEFDHIGRMKHYMHELIEMTNGLDEIASVMRKPTNLDELETYGEMQDAIIAIVQNMNVLLKGFMHLSNRGTQQEN